MLAYLFYSFAMDFHTKGGLARAAVLTTGRKVEIAKLGAAARWHKKRGPMSIFLIAEIGINHNGDVEIAKKLIEAAASAGFDAVKFQKRTVNVVYSKAMLDSPRESPWGKTQRAQKEGLEFGVAEYDEIDRYCRKLGIKWSASAWDIKSQEFLRQYNLAFNKVASPMLGNKPLLRAIASEGRKTYISTGMATHEEIDSAVDTFKFYQCPFELMHCVSTYPMKNEHANLLVIPRLRARHGCEVGYSGHETDLIKVCIAAVALGATSIERHITLDKTMYGSDQAASIEAHDLANFVSVMRSIPAIMGTGKKEIIPDEMVARNKLRVEVG
jgi:N-acetylneuraminate synthase